jgi:alpha-aminoadipate carrier protein LysW
MDSLAVACPECEAPFAIPPLPAGETLSCPECLLTLRVNQIDDRQVDLEMVPIELKDWGQ